MWRLEPLLAYPFCGMVRMEAEQSDTAEGTEDMDKQVFAIRSEHNYSYNYNYHYLYC